MIRFFRQIRYKLLSENKTSGYIKYAIGEIALVVIGILIALQINNWNEDRKDEKALNEYLVKIKSHTLEDIQELEKMMDGRKRTAETCKQARSSILDKTEDENLFLFMGAGLALVEYYFKPNTGGYEALKSSEYFGKINNTPLDSLLTEYHGMIELIAENEKSYNDYTVEQSSYLSREFDRSLILAYIAVPHDSLFLRATPRSEFYEAYAEYTKSVPYRNIISLAAFQFDLMIDQYQQLSDIGQSVIKEIDVMVPKEQLDAN